MNVTFRHCGVYRCMHGETVIITEDDTPGWFVLEYRCRKLNPWYRVASGEWIEGMVKAGVLHRMEG